MVTLNGAIIGLLMELESGLAGVIGFDDRIGRQNGVFRHDDDSVLDSPGAKVGVCASGERLDYRAGADADVFIDNGALDDAVLPQA
jgi:hypothetical protein